MGKLKKIYLEKIYNRTWGHYYLLSTVVRWCLSLHKDNIIGHLHSHCWCHFTNDWIASGLFLARVTNPAVTVLSSTGLLQRCGELCSRLWNWSTLVGGDSDNINNVNELRFWAESELIVDMKITGWIKCKYPHILYLHLGKLLLIPVIVSLCDGPHENCSPIIQNC